MAVDVCGRCKALVRADQKYCHRCGRFAPALFGARKWFDALYGSDVGHSRVLLGVIAFVYVVETWATQRLPDEGVRGVASLLAPSNRALDALGALLPWDVTRHEPWRMLTSCLLHGNVVHVLVNGSSLLVAGPYIEHLFGRARFWIVFVATGLGGSVAYLLFGEGAAVGASGALFGFIGTMIAWGVRYGGSIGRAVRDQAVKWLVYGVAISFVPGIAMSAHVGGAATGFALGWIFQLPTVRGGRESDLARFGGLLAMALLAAAAVALVAFDLRHLRDL